ncbi:hypothetical protein BKA61DRAFT_683416 [Leptodontidium sp. MPI-SDFR-AT-0119]|nr:hypothetical protein BKA61DRAFT_683416 [Leptodontidium sp. MPI-SDFR-AT-0119]
MALLFTVFLFARSCYAVTTAYAIASRPPVNAARIDPAPVGFSYDYGFDEWWFNVGNTRSCTSNLENLTGKWPLVRLAGGMDDTSVFDPDLAVTRVNANITGIADAQYYGPLYLIEVLAKYPGPIIFGLNRGAGNLSNTVLASKYLKTDLPNLVAVELGNEPDSKKPEPPNSNISAPQLIVVQAGGVAAWTPTVEAASEVEWQLAIGKAMHTRHIVQAGGYVAPISYTNATYLFSQETKDALKYVGSFSHHFYPQSISPLAIGIGAPNLEHLMSHVNTSKNVEPFALDTAATDALDLDYVFGETNTVSGGGSPIISPTFGAGIYILDYVLRATSSNIVRLNFHFQSYGTSYYIWWDKTGIRSPYYGGYAATDILAGQSYISALDNGTTNYAGYIIYSKSKKPSKVVLINTDYFDGNGTRSTHDFVLSGLTTRTLSAKRLTAANALSRQDFGQAPTYGGQFFSNTGCNLCGEEVVERVSVKDGKATFTLFASEALVVSL